MSREIVFTHKGWFGICPVYLAGLDSDAPNVEARYWALKWLIDLFVWIFGAVIWLRTSMDPLYEPEWPLLITGELNPPLVRHD